MAKVGAVYRFVSAKVAANAAKPKFHVAIDLSCGFLLFINSDDYPGAMKIDRTDWPEMPKPESFISCSAGIRYSKQDLNGVKIDPAGCLTEDCLRRLHQHIMESETMPQVDIDIAVAALAAALEI
jgi:hypothetical protein